MRMFNWLKESNRLKHLGFGFLIYFVTAFVGVVAVNLATPDLEIEYHQVYSLIASWMAMFNVASCMASVEFIQHDIGGKFDWLDIAAGVMIPAVINILGLILFLV